MTPSTVTKRGAEETTPLSFQLQVKASLSVSVSNDCKRTFDPADNCTVPVGLEAQLGTAFLTTVHSCSEVPDVDTTVAFKILEPVSNSLELTARLKPVPVIGVPLTVQDTIHVGVAELTLKVWLPLDEASFKLATSGNFPDKAQSGPTLTL